MPYYYEMLLALLFPSKLITLEPDPDDMSQEGTQPEPKAPPRCGKTAKIIAHLEKVHFAMMAALDQHDFDIDSDVWTHFAETLHMQVSMPELGVAVEYHDPMTKLEYLQTQKEFFEGHPGFKVRCVGHSVKVDRRAGKAVLMQYVRFEGTADGMGSECAAMLEFRCLEGKWLVCCISSMLGVDMLAFDGT